MLTSFVRKKSFVFMPLAESGRVSGECKLRVNIRGKSTAARHAVPGTQESSPSVARIFKRLT
jgi:hypothetical protein